MRVVWLLTVVPFLCFPVRAQLHVASDEIHDRPGGLIHGKDDATPVNPLPVQQDLRRTIRVPDKPTGRPWARHVIDANSRGADGIRVADINADGRPDLTAGWEEGGQVSVYLHPGADRSRRPWPAVVVGRVASPEDAVFIDVDGDGRLDVVSSCEGKERTVFAHLAPRHGEILLDPMGWTTAAFPATRRMTRWMFGLPMQIDGEHGNDLVLAAKGENANVGWLQAPANPNILGNWRWRPLSRVGWIMSLRHEDLDGDGDRDILFSDRKGSASGCWWLEHPGVENALRGQWRKHLIGGRDREVMFMDLADLDGDGREDVVSAVRQDDVMVAYRRSAPEPLWEEAYIPMPRRVGTGKAVAVGDIDGDGQADIVVTCENAKHVSGVFWFRGTNGHDWSAQDISGANEGVKFDRIELLDLDEDGDLDVITCEEGDNLGVIWYENPREPGR